MVSSLNELIGFVELTEFREIWPERQLNNEEQKCVDILLKIKYFPRGGLGTRHVFIFFNTWTWHIY